MPGSRVFVVVAVAMTCGCTNSEDCVPMLDIRESAVHDAPPTVPHPDLPRSDVREPIVHPVLALNRCVASVFDKHGETFVELPGGATRRVAGTTFVEASHVAHRDRSVTSTGPIHVHTDVAADQLGIVARVVDSHETALSAFRFEMPTTPAVGLDDRITSGSGDPCAMGIADMRSWRTRAGIVVTVQYSISDLCDGRVPDICSTVVLPIPGDLPTHD